MMVHTKCSKCNTGDTHEEIIGSHMELDPRSDLIDEDGNHVKKIERFLTVCNNCGQGCQIIDLDDLDRGKVNLYELTKKSKTDEGIREFIPNTLEVD